ncbi:4-oxalocrotonate tautomerase [Sporosarcina sp. P18a]|uniref:Tautomerase n=1 Tax=Sporosarcina ureae TaxID=1571 RepID=A0ABM6JU47_SPOUR|nr:MULTISPECIES: 4-oxalocrotonate tautomerase [Sporosarcina]ARF13642.1 4-oxalocrotonate tautomerase [Sporosarcina ureae]PIC78776.1 4-oxalocrotonate tautomerase [Sporosarcina sp. P18a]PID02977.1 4-oxalocrotonate tautomerase [Sporosarcina sp. P2]PID24067.1 4-oxalocrotonate tautomerase [Sporosarcina sp. P7]
MPLIHVEMIEGRPEEKVSELIRNITEVVSSTLDAPKEAVRVIVSEVPSTHWGVAGQTMAEKRAAVK